jgi:hypothetical protein
MELAVRSGRRPVAQHVVVVHIVHDAGDGLVELVHVADDEAAGVDGQAVDRVVAEVHLRQHSRVGVGSRWSRIVDRRHALVEAARVERIQAHVGPRRHSHHFFDERPGILGDEALRHQQERLASVESRQVRDEAAQQLQRSRALGACRIGE